MLIRAVSAIVALVLLFSIGYFFKATGLEYLCLLVGLSAIDEYSRLTFNRGGWPIHLRLGFLTIASAILLLMWSHFDWSIYVFAVGSVIFTAMALISIRSTGDLGAVLTICGLSIIGFIYCGLFSGFVVHLISLEDGLTWFFGLLAIVFSGDTSAYLAGRLFGRRKLLEAVSPKKTVEGSIGGLCGSALAGLLLGHYFLRDRSLGTIILIALTTGAFAQLGDLFESLVKRVAEVKDSGSIMPGHGGILDRIDGVLFAAPIYYVLARFLVL